MYLAASNKKKAETNGHDGEDLFHAAVFEKNRGNLDRALDLVKRSNGKRDADGRLHYLAACCHALVGDAEQALQNLRRAVAADQQNRIQARLEMTWRPSAALRVRRDRHRRVSVTTAVVISPRARAFG
jgi:tetratricopeptide (TPR) repeat protein